MRLACLARMFVALTITTGVVRASGADDPPTEIEKARSAYEKARKKHEADFLKQFDTAAERITNLAALAVFTSILAHGLTDKPGADWIARRA